MTSPLDDLSDAQVFTAVRLVATELLVTTMTRAGLSETEADDRVLAMTRQLSSLPQGIVSQEDEADLVVQVRQLLSALTSGQDPDLQSLTQGALLKAEISAGTVAGGEGKLNWIISAGFAISLLVILSQTSISGNVGPFHIEKNAGIPVEVVQIVKAVTEAIPQVPAKRDDGADPEKQS